ncbi:MAG: MFS transporter [Elusimicrobiota bacterium]|jgi:MFS family permease|nr:MFS transporter [Elusimicrobiota bacterium]
MSILSLKIFKSLSIRNYRLFFIGHSVSVTGTWLQLTAMPWLVYTITGSAAMLGIVAFLDQIFILFASPIAGTIADRFSRKKLLLITQSFLFMTTLLLAILTISDSLEIWHIVAIATINGIISAFDMTFRQSFVLDLVPKENLMNAVGLNSLVFNSARVIGPSIAGILIAQIGIGFCFLFNSFSYLFAVAALVMMKLGKQEIKEISFSIKSQVNEGIKFLKQDISLAYLLAMLSFMGILFSAVMVLIPLYVKDIYALDAHGFGFFVTSIGIGSLFATFTIASRTSVVGIKNIIFTASLAAGAILFLFGAVINVYATCLLLALLGFCFVLIMGLMNSLVQISAPSQNRGVIIGFFMSLYGIAPIGSLISGYVSGVYNPRITAIIGGACLIVLALLLRKKILNEK